MCTYTTRVRGKRSYFITYIKKYFTFLYLCLPRVPCVPVYTHLTVCPPVLPDGITMVIAELQIAKIVGPKKIFDNFGSEWTN